MRNRCYCRPSTPESAGLLTNPAQRHDHSSSAAVLGKAVVLRRCAYQAGLPGSGVVAEGVGRDDQLRWNSPQQFFAAGRQPRILPAAGRVRRFVEARYRRLPRWRESRSNVRDGPL